MRALVAPLVVFASCLDPTEVNAIITTDANCVDVHDVTIFTGTLEAIAQTTTVTAQTTTCNAGRIGNIVLVPSGSKGPAGIRVVMGLGKTSADQCVKSGFKGGCIVARRSIGYVQHRALTLPIELQISCIDVPCNATTTCVNGQCVPADVGTCDPMTGCPPSDAGMPDAGDGGAPPPLTAISIGSTGGDVVTALAVDPGGGLYVGGKFAGTVDFGGLMSSTMAQGALFMARYEPTLAVKWIYAPPQTTMAGNTVTGIAASTSSVTGSGYVINTVDLGNGSMSPTNYAGFYAARARDGSPLHARLFGGNGDFGFGAAIDAAGNVYTVGTCTAPTMIGAASCGQIQAFIASYDKNDGLRWTHVFGSPAADAAYAVAITGTTLVVGGNAGGAIDYGSGQFQTSQGVSNAFLAAYDTANGAYKWSRVIGDAGNQHVQAIATDGTNVFAAGSFDTTISDGPPIVAQGSDGFLWTVDLATGKGKSLRRFGGTGVDTLFGVTTDGAGGALVCGSFSGAADLGAGSVTANGPQDLFVASVSANNTVKVKTFGGPSTDDCYAIVSDSPTSVVIGGDYLQSIMFNGTTLTSKGALDGFIARVPRP